MIKPIFIFTNKCLFCLNDMIETISKSQCLACNVRSYIANDFPIYYFDVKDLVACLSEKELTIYKNGSFIANYNLLDLNWKLSDNKEDNLKIFDIINMILTFE